MATRQETRSVLGSNVNRITRRFTRISVVNENEAQQRQNDLKSAIARPTSSIAATKDGPTKQGILTESIANNVKTKLALLERRNTLDTGSKDTKPVAPILSKAHRISFNVGSFGGGYMLISVDFADDIDRYTRHLEGQFCLAPNFLAEHRVDGRMRMILVDWLIHVQKRFSLHGETLSLAVWILDKSLTKLKTITKANLQLLGVTCLFVAAKFEEITVPHIGDFVYVAADVFGKKDILKMEQAVLKAVGFQLSITHSIQFLRRYRFFISGSDELHNLAKFISEVGLLFYQLAHHKPSDVANVSLHLAAHILDLELPERLYTEEIGMDKKEVTSMALKFVEPVLQMANPSEKLYALREKYKKTAPIPFTEDRIKGLRKLLATNKPTTL